MLSLVYMAILSLSEKTTGPNEARQSEFSQLAPAGFGMLHHTPVES